MTVQAVVPKNEVVQKAQEFAAEQNWSTEASAIYVALMNLFAGTGSWLWNSAFINHTHPVHDLRDALKAEQSNNRDMDYGTAHDLIIKHPKFIALR
jgi:hypothetical protein